MANVIYQRMRATPAIITIVLMLCSGFSPATFALQPVPEYQAFVTDTTGTLSSADKNRLEQRLKSVQEQHIAEMAVLIVGSTQPETIFTYAMRVAEQWKVGRKQKDDGVLLVIALQDRTTQILAGYELEDRITDVAANRILRDIIPPYFRAGDFAGGIDAAISALLIAIESIPTANTDASVHSQSDHSDLSGYESILGLLLVFGFFWFLFGRIFLRLIFGKGIAAVATLVIMFLASLIAGVSISGAFFLALILMVVVSGSSGRSRGFLGSGGRSGGGFSGGGGGRFGGGGASGRW